MSETNGRAEVAEAQATQARRFALSHVEIEAFAQLDARHRALCQSIVESRGGDIERRHGLERDAQGYVVALVEVLPEGKPAEGQKVEEPND